MLREFGSGFPADPFTPGIGGGVGSTEDYDGAVSISDEDQDTEYDLEINFIDDSLTPSQQAVFEDAANRWEEIIIGGVPDVVVPDFGPVDDIVIDASAPLIDGQGDTLGQAGPTVFREGSFLPVRGIMEFDSADIDSTKPVPSSLILPLIIIIKPNLLRINLGLKPLFDGAFREAVKSQINSARIDRETKNLILLAKVIFAGNNCTTKTINLYYGD